MRLKNVISVLKQVDKEVFCRKTDIMRTFAVCTEHCIVSEVRSNEIREKIFFCLKIDRYEMF